MIVSLFVNFRFGFLYVFLLIVITCLSILILLYFLKQMKKLNKFDMYEVLIFFMVNWFFGGPLLVFILFRVNIKDENKISVCFCILNSVLMKLKLGIFVCLCGGMHASANRFIYKGDCPWKLREFEKLFLLQITRKNSKTINHNLYSQPNTTLIFNQTPNFE